MPKSTPKCTLRGFLRNGISGGPKLGHLLAPYKQQFVGTSEGTMCSISQICIVNNCVWPFFIHLDSSIK